MSSITITVDEPLAGMLRRTTLKELRDEAERLAATASSIDAQRWWNPIKGGANVEELGRGIDGVREHLTALGLVIDQLGYSQSDGQLTVTAPPSVIASIARAASDDLGYELDERPDGSALNVVSLRVAADLWEGLDAIMGLAEPPREAVAA